MLHSVFLLHDEIDNKYYHGPYNDWVAIQEAKIWHRAQDAKRAKTTATREFDLRYENAMINYNKNPNNYRAAEEYFDLKNRSQAPDLGLKIVQFELVPVISS